MKKVQLYIILLIVIVLFASTDYFVNTPLSLSALIPQQGEEDTDVADPYPNLTQIFVGSDTDGFGYTVVKRDRTQQLFEKFDLSSVKDIRIYKNILNKKGGGVAKPVIVYEIQGPKNQGKITYLNVKLKVIDQKDITSNLNEVSGFGYNGFFYNDKNNENTGFLLTQIKDTLFGFQYSKAETDKEAFDTIKDMVDALMILN
jgi:hypothetical protein